MNKRDCEYDRTEKCLSQPGDMPVMYVNLSDFERDFSRSLLDVRIT